MAKRYLVQFRMVASLYADVDPAFARTVAHATFMASDPIRTAEQHVGRFCEMQKEYRGRVTAIRTLAREAWRAERPQAAAQKFIEDHNTIVTNLRKDGADVTVARTIASIACLHADPIAKGDELAANFEAALEFTRAMCPHAARSIALSACRSPDPRGAARRYVDTYQRIVQLVSRRDPRYAHSVASLVFRCDQSLWAARRYLRALHRKRQAS
jgi:hypothetical protein